MSTSWMEYEYQISINWYDSLGDELGNEWYFAYKKCKKNILSNFRSRVTEVINKIKGYNRVFILFCWINIVFCVKTRYTERYKIFVLNTNKYVEAGV